MKTCFQTILCVVCTLLLCASVMADESEFAVMLENYYRFLLNKEVTRQGEGLMETAGEDDAHAVQEALDGYSQAVNNRIRDELSRSIGNSARELFESFVAEYTVAESRGDPAFLSDLADLANLSPAPADYPALRRYVMEGALGAEVKYATTLLSDLQTWLDMKGREKDMPPLDIWLARNEKPETPKAKPVNPLQAAEAALPAFEAEESEPFNPLDAYTQMRKKKRERAMAEAHAGMQQVAAERDAVEKEYAAEKAARAQAEADAMKAHAQQLAAVEKEAMEQRQNSWGNRIKRIIGGTISAATGAFSGGIGAAAGQRAVEEIFR